MKEYILKKQRSSNSRLLLYVLVAVIMMFVGIQLYVLTSVGVQGEKINQIKQEQNKLRIENEIKSAEVQTLQSRREVLDSIENLNMTEAEVRLVDVETHSASINL